MEMGDTLIGTTIYHLLVSVGPVQFHALGAFAYLTCRADHASIVPLP